MDILSRRKATNATLRVLATHNATRHPLQSVAVCISGTARSFTLPMVYGSIIRHMLPSLGNNFVVFAALTLRERHSAGMVLRHPSSAGNVGDAIAVTREDVRSALDALNVSQRAVRLRDVDLTAEELLALISNAPHCLGHHVRHPLTPSLIAQLENAHACMQLIWRHEEEEGVRFDRMVHARPDATWIKPATRLRERPHSNTLLTSSKLPAYQDWAVFGERTAMVEWFGRLESINHTCTSNGSHIGNKSSMNLARLPLDQALPVGSGMVKYYNRRPQGRVRVRVVPYELPVVVVRPNALMKTTYDICRAKNHLYQDTTSKARTNLCLRSLYDFGYENASGRPWRNVTGPWW